MILVPYSRIQLLLIDLFVCVCIYFLWQEERAITMKFQTYFESAKNEVDLLYKESLSITRRGI